jgi:hypothetical protein
LSLHDLSLDADEAIIADHPARTRPMLAGKSVEPSAVPISIPPSMERLYKTARLRRYRVRTPSTVETQFLDAQLAF